MELEVFVITVTRVKLRLKIALNQSANTSNLIDKHINVVLIKPSTITKVSIVDSLLSLR